MGRGGGVSAGEAGSLVTCLCGELLHLAFLTSKCGQYSKRTKSHHVTFLLPQLPAN